MAPRDSGLHVTLTVVGNIWSSDVSVGLPATGETRNYLYITYVIKPTCCTVVVMLLLIIIITIIMYIIYIYNFFNYYIPSQYSTDLW